MVPNCHRSRCVVLESANRLYSNYDTSSYSLTWCYTKRVDTDQHWLVRKNQRFVSLFIVRIWSSDWSSFILIALAGILLLFKTKTKKPLWHSHCRDVWTYLVYHLLVPFSVQAHYILPSSLPECFWFRFWINEFFLGLVLIAAPALFGYDHLACKHTSANISLIWR